MYTLARKYEYVQTTNWMNGMRKSNGIGAELDVESARILCPIRTEKSCLNLAFQSPCNASTIHKKHDPKRSAMCTNPHSSTQGTVQVSSAALYVFIWSSVLN